MIRTVSANGLGGYAMPGISVRDHFRKVPENSGGPRFCLGPLRTLAETTIDPGCGFPMHAHRDFEIISYVCTGELTHADTLGNRGRLAAGDVQVMTSGTGIRHSEVNDGTQPVRMYQFWIEPRTLGLAPDYVDLHQPAGGATNALRVLVSNAGPARIDQDAALLAGRVEAGCEIDHPLDRDRHTYVLAAAGRFRLGDVELRLGDGAEVGGTGMLQIAALEDSDIVIVDLPRSSGPD